MFGLHCIMTETLLCVYVRARARVCDCVCFLVCARVIVCV